MRLIDAADAFTVLTAYYHHRTEEMHNSLREALDRVPTVDAVPVVRCKYCKHWGTHKSLNVPWCFEMHIDKSEGGYCDSGERKRRCD